MQQRKLGNQGLTVSCLGLGCMGMSWAYGTDRDEGESIAIEGLPYDRGQGESEQERFATVRVGPSAPSRVTAPGASTRAGQQ